MNRKFFYLDEIHTPLLLSDILKNSWLAILAAFSVCVAIFAYDTLFHQPTYTAETTFVVSPRSNDSYISFYSAMNTANEMAEVFQEVFSSDVLKRLVREDLQNQKLSFSVSCSVAKDTNILCVYATADTPEHAHAVMQSVLENYRDVSGYLFGGVVLDVLKNPQVPLSPSNPLPATTLMIVGSILASLAILGLIALISVLRPTIKTLSCAQRRMEESPVGILYQERPPLHLFQKKQKKAPLITDSNISFQYTEALLQIHHTLRHRMQKNGYKVLLVTSVAENEGKSTFSANLALALATHGHRVALVDLDLRRPAIYKIFRQFPKNDLLTCIQEGAPATWDAENYLHLVTLSKPCANPSKVLHSSELAQLLTVLKDKMDYVILDSSPYTATADSGMLLQHADCSVMVVRQDWATYQICKDVAEDIAEGQADYLGYIINHYRSNSVAQYTNSYYRKYGYYGKKYPED